MNGLASLFFICLASSLTLSDFHVIARIRDCFASLAMTRLFSCHCEARGAEAISKIGVDLARAKVVYGGQIIG